MMKRIKHIMLAGMLISTAMPAWADNASMQLPDMPALSVQMNFDSNAKQKRSDVFARYAQQKPSRRISASQAKSIALRRYPGARFINVQLRGNQYIVRLQLKNGRIVDVSVDASPR